MSTFKNFKEFIARIFKVRICIVPCCTKIRPRTVISEVHTCEHGYQTMHQEKGKLNTVATKSGRLK